MGSDLEKKKLENEQASIVSKINEQTAIFQREVSSLNVVQRFVNAVRSDANNSAMADTLQIELRKHVEGEVRARFEQIARDRELSTEAYRHQQQMAIGVEIAAKAEEITLGYAGRINDLVLRYLDQNSAFYAELDARVEKGVLSQEQRDKLTSVKEASLAKLIEKQSQGLDKLIDEKCQKVIDLLTSG